MAVETQEKQLPPRVLVVENIVKYSQENYQKLDLKLLSRENSEHLVNHLDEFKDIKTILDYAIEHSKDYICKPSSSLAHERILKIDNLDSKYNLGQILTDKEVFDLGYYEPYADTHCARIADKAMELRTLDNDKLTEALRQSNLIGEEYRAEIERDSNGEHFNIDIIKNDYHFYKPKEVNNNYPICLYLFPDDPVGVGCAYFVEDQNDILTFMSYFSRNWEDEF
ncbi:hypothetical protein ACFL1H_01615 [Nanoarchaeota archaeon]